MVLGRNYRAAIDCLNSLQSGYENLERSRRYGQRLRKGRAVNVVRNWLTLMGLHDTDLHRLNAIHIAGTKGKGSTAIFVDSILREHRERSTRPLKVGLYTSPHLEVVRERIKINSSSISEQTFAEHFFKVWDFITHNEHKNKYEVPGYFGFLTLLAFECFITEGVDIAVIETGVGGEYDATNLLRSPAAVGITALDYDHVRALRVDPEARPSYLKTIIGDTKRENATIEEIAWHKGGIFKGNVAPLSVPQRSRAESILRLRASEKQTTLSFVDQALGVPWLSEVPRMNASLAIALVHKLHQRGALITGGKTPTTPVDTVRGIRRAQLLGRCQLVEVGQEIWLLDGAHTTDSLSVAARWCASFMQENSCLRILIFRHQSQRDSHAFLVHLARDIKEQGAWFDHAIFCTGYRHTDCPDLVNRNAGPESRNHPQLKAHAETFHRLFPTSTTSVADSVEAAIALARTVGNESGFQCLVTGSIYIVGSAISVLREAEC